MSTARFIRLVGGSVLAGVVVAALAAALVRGLGDDGTDAARGVDSARVLALARGALSEDPRRAALSALLAHRVAPSADADLAMVDIAVDHLGVERTIPAHNGKVTAAARTGDVVVSAGDDGMLRVWRAATGALLAERRLDSPIVRLAAAPSGSLVAACDSRGRVAVWRLGDPTAPAATELRGAWPGATPPLLLAFVAQGTDVLAVGRDGLLRRWDVATGERRFAPHLREVAGITWTGGQRAPEIVAASVPEDTYDPVTTLLVATRAGEVADIRLESVRGNLLATPGRLPGRVTSLAGAPYSDDVAVGTTGGLALVGGDRVDPYVKPGPAVTGVALVDDALMVASTEGVVATATDELWGPQIPRGRGALTLAGGVNGIVAIHRGGAISLLDASRSGLALEPGAVTSVAAFAPGGDLLVTEGWDARLIQRLLLLRPGEPGRWDGSEVPHRVVRSFEPPTSWWPQDQDETPSWYVNDAVVDERFVVAGGQDPTGTASVLVWDASTGRPLRRLPLTSGGIDTSEPPIVTSVASLPEHELVAAYSLAQETLVLWSTDTWRQIATVDIGPAGALAVSPDEQTIIVNGLSDKQSGVAAGFDRSRLLLFDVEAEHVRDELPTDATYRLALAPDGERVATLEEGGRLRIRSLDDGHEVRRPIALDDEYPLALAWRPDGEAIAVAGEAGVVLVDPSSGRMSAPLPPLADETFPLTLAWSPDGELLAAGNAADDDEGAPDLAEPTLWTVGRAPLARRLCVLAGRQATVVEWRSWTGDIVVPDALCPAPAPVAPAAAPKIEEPIVAYRRDDAAWIAGIDGRSRRLSDLPEHAWPPAHFAWSPRGALAWASGGEVFRLIPGAERARSWACPCDRAAFDGEAVIALNRSGTQLLRFSPDSDRATGVEVAGLPSHDPRLVAAAGGEVLASAYSQEPSRATPSELFRIRANGSVDRVKGDTEGVIWQPAATDPDDDAVAFVAGWSGGVCFSPSAVGLVDLGDARVIRPPGIADLDEQEVVRSLSWPRDGELHAHRAPIGCSDDLRLPSKQPLGTLSTLRGDAWEPTPEQGHDVQVGSRATALVAGPLDASATSGTLELILPGGDRVQVADDVEAFAVRP